MGQKPVEISKYRYELSIVNNRGNLSGRRNSLKPQQVAEESPHHHLAVMLMLKNLDEASRKARQGDLMAEKSTP